MITKVTRNISHPLIGKICQYRVEHNLKHVATDYPKNINYCNYGFNSDSPAPSWIRASFWLSLSPETIQQNIWIMPTKEGKDSIDNNKPLYECIDSRLESLLNQEPWLVNHPYAMINDVNSIFLYTKKIYADSIKPVVVPLSHIVLERYVKNVLVTKCSMLYCSVSIPDKEVGFYWIRPEWIEEHTHRDSYQKDAEVRIASAVKTIIRNCKAQSRE